MLNFSGRNWLFLILMLSIPACTANSAPAPAGLPASQPASQPSGAVSQKVFDGGKKLGICFKFPDGWKEEKASTAVFDVANTDGKGYSSLSLDIPKLPLHIPGMITPGMVAGGYIDDLKKNEIHDAKVEENVDAKVPGVPARRVKCSGHQNGKPAIDVAVIAVHNDRVYILSCDSDDDGYNVARAALDAAVASIEWIK